MAAAQLHIFSAHWLPTTTNLGWYSFDSYAIWCNIFQCNGIFSAHWLPTTSNLGDICLIHTIVYTIFLFPMHLFPMRWYLFASLTADHNLHTEALHFTEESERLVFVLFGFGEIYLWIHLFINGNWVLSQLGLCCSGEGLKAEDTILYLHFLSHPKFCFWKWSSKVFRMKAPQYFSWKIKPEM